MLNLSMIGIMSITAENNFLYTYLFTQSYMYMFCVLILCWYVQNSVCFNGYCFAPFIFQPQIVNNVLLKKKKLWQQKRPLFTVNNGFLGLIALINRIYSNITTLNI